jgi:hypothetical protein
MRWRGLLSLLFMIIAVGLGSFIAWLGTTPTIDAFYTKIFDRRDSGTSEPAPPP